jgi:thiamine transport system ATP-binding protein
MLALDRVSVSYDGVPAVREASLELPDGQVLAVLGPSGCGKSTLLRAVAGLEPLVSGEVAWDGADLARVPTHKRGFALMFQDGQLFDHLTVARNIGYALRLRRAPGIAARVEELLVLVGLEGYAERLSATLSGGERQRVALARCLAVRPRLLLLDEPLSALDAGLRQRLATDLRSILTHEGTTALMVTHDHEEAFTVADRLAVMRAGEIVQQGAIDEVWRTPADADTALFLGYARVLEGPAAAIVRDVCVVENGVRATQTSRTIPVWVPSGRPAQRVADQVGQRVYALEVLALRHQPGQGVGVPVLQLGALRTELLELGVAASGGARLGRRGICHFASCVRAGPPWGAGCLTGCIEPASARSRAGLREVDGALRLRPSGGRHVACN